VKTGSISTRVGSQEYQDVMRGHVRAWLDAKYPKSNIWGQLGGIQSHTVTKMQDQLMKNLADFSPSMI